MRRVVVLALLTLLVSGCVPMAQPRSSAIPSVPTVSPPASVYAEAQVAVPDLIAAERAAAIANDLPLLSTLWAPDAQIIDGRSTVSSDDDYVWAGHDAILDRYRVAVFPNPPPPLDGLPKLQLTVDGSDALVTNGVDEWHFVQRDGRWWIVQLAYLRP